MWTNLIVLESNIASICLLYSMLLSKLYLLLNPTTSLRSDSDRREEEETSVSESKTSDSEVARQVTSASEVARQVTDKCVRSSKTDATRRTDYSSCSVCRRIKVR
jgi:hypothetical protein